MPGRVIAIALKVEHKLPLQPVDHARVTEEGLVGNVRQGVRRRITLLERGQWEQAQQELGGDAPWTTRRANILTDGLSLGACIGKRLRINEVVLHVNGETDPCDEMDRRQPGLQAALSLHCRGGVYASVIHPGVIHAGDTIEVISPECEADSEAVGR